MNRAGVLTAVLRSAALLTIGSAVVATPVHAQGWTSQASGTIENLKTIDFPNSSIGYAAGQNGTILKTANGGASWGPQSSGTTNLLWSLDFLDTSTGWVVGQNGTLRKTTDGGTNWNPLNPGTTGNIRDVYFVDALTGWIVGSTGEIRKTTDGGSSWNPQTSGTSEILTGVAFANASTGWVVGNAGTLLSTTDGGSTWNPQTSGTTEDLLAVSAISTSTAYVVGQAGTILKTTNGGAAWTPQTSGTTAAIWHSHFVNATTGYVTGSNPTIILKTVDGGGNWVSQDPGTLERLRAVYFVDALTGWAVGDAGTVLHTTDGGGGPRFVVDTNSDVADGDTTSIAALLANKGADGLISLREAIVAANRTPNGAVPDSITFDIGGGGAQTISPATALPTITEAVVIDGTTQPGFTSSPIIEISGATVGAGIGLNVTGGGSTIRGLVINRFTTGLQLASGDGNLVAGNYIGLDVTGTTGGVGNASEGILIQVARNNVIGGTSVSDRNVISGNVVTGVMIEDIADGAGVAADGNRITGNYVGTNAAGTDRVLTGAGSYQQYGIWINGAPDTWVGGTGPGEGNVLSGNAAGGVWVYGADASGNLIRGNIIGLDETGSNPVPNGVAGVGTGVLIMDAPGNTVGGPEAGAANVISGNEGVGVTIMTGINAGNVVSRNSIYGNADLGVDLSYDGVTANDLGDVDTGPNGLFNFPLIQSAVIYISVDTLELRGFARPGSTIELFISDNDVSDFGEGQTYLVTLVEGGAGDLDGGIGSYTYPSAGSDSTNRFRFRIGTPPGVLAGTILTATATDAGDGTSEFAFNTTVTEPPDPRISSIANQTFWVGEAPTPISPIQVSDSGSVAAITAANDIRIRIPAGFNMSWDVTDNTATVLGSVARVSTTVSYEDGGKTLVVDVTADFAPGDGIRISGLSFVSFTGISGADNLELEIDNAGTVADVDSRTIEILASGTPTISSDFDQSFRVGSPPVAMSIMTLVEDSIRPSVTAANDIRIRVPVGFDMIWDTSDTNATILGTAVAKVSSTVSYEDGGRTLVIDVLADFVAGDVITIQDLSFANFTAISFPADNLELEVLDDGGTTSLDDKTIFIIFIASTPHIVSAENQTFAVGNPPTDMIILRVTDDPVPVIKAATDIRITIPNELPMIWDTSVTDPVLSGRGRSSVSTTVSYQDGGKTLVIDVLTDFSSDDWLNVKGLRFMSFASASAARHLQLDVDDDAISDAFDERDKIILGPSYDMFVSPDTVWRNALPSNGTNYQVDFTVSNIGSIADGADLLTTAVPGGAISVVSITGPGITQGANPDSAGLASLAPGGSATATVTYSVGDVPEGTIDTIIFVARSTGNPGESDDGRLIFSVIRPDLTIAKAVAPNGTQAPGTDLTYTVTVTNAGTEAAVAVSSVDSLAAEVRYKVGSTVTNFPAGIGVTVEYSDDDGATWTYSPVTGGCGAPAGYDDCVTGIRWNLQDDLGAAAPDNAGDVQFVARIK